MRGTPFHMISGSTYPAECRDSDPTYIYTEIDIHIYSELSFLSTPAIVCYGLSTSINCFFFGGNTAINFMELKGTIQRLFNLNTSDSEIMISKQSDRSVVVYFTDV